MKCEHISDRLYFTSPETYLDQYMKKEEIINNFYQYLPIC